MIPLILIVLLACALRLHHSARSPLRGDEAFAMRYWAAPPAEILKPGGLAWVEPHPFGAFFSFWAWKSLVGESEFAMRLLPALTNLLGVPALYALGRRLFRSSRVGLAAALLWAVNPNLIWHSQDVRNYAIWVGFSAVSLWLMLRATDRAGEGRRIGWALYVLAAALALYMFFTELFMLAVHGLYVLLFRRHALRGWLLAMAALAVLLVPWFGQIAALAGSGYRGAIPDAGQNVLIVALRFWTTLLFGETLQPDALPVFVAGIWLLTTLRIVLRRPRTGGLMLIAYCAPLALLLAAAMRLNVLDSRYLMAVTPAVILPFAWGAAVRPEPRAASSRRALPAYAVCAAGHAIVFVVYCALTLSALAHYYSPTYDKAPDWYGLRDYLRAHVTAEDTVIFPTPDPATGVIDPAFGYYYTGPAHVLVLPYPGADTLAFVQSALAEKRAVWLVVTGNFEPVEAALRANGILVSDEAAGRAFTIKQFRKQFRQFR